MKWENLSKLLSQVNTSFGSFRTENWTTIGRQTGVIRTNCMDNLDRTNVVQSLFARREILNFLGTIDQSKHVLHAGDESFETVFKALWANHGDCLSILYAGTRAMKSDFTR